MIMGAAHVSNVNNLPYYEGDLSAVLIRNLPFYADLLRVPSRSVALMGEWESKIQKIAETTVHKKVTSLRCTIVDAPAPETYAGDDWQIKHP